MGGAGGGVVGIGPVTSGAFVSVGGGGVVSVAAGTGVGVALVSVGAEASPVILCN